MPSSGSLLYMFILEKELERLLLLVVYASYL